MILGSRTKSTPDIKQYNLELNEFTNSNTRDFSKSITSIMSSKKYTQPFPATSQESASSARLIKTLNMLSHPEGGYFVETDRSVNHIIPNPFLTSPPRDPFPTTSATTNNSDDNNQTRNASTTIFYLLTPVSAKGHFHRNKGRTMHVHHRGRARYVILHADEWDGEKGTCRVEDYIVGPSVEDGERLQWMVEGGKYKASYLLPSEGEMLEEGEGVAEDVGGCLITEVVVPGFDYADHDFMTFDRLVLLVGEEKAEEMRWLVRKD